MVTRNISLTAEQDAFVDEIVKSGEYQNASEAMRDALRALQQRRQHDELKLELLRAEIALGAAELDRGEAVEVSDHGLERYFAGLGKGAARSRAQKTSFATIAAEPRRARRKKR